MGKDDQYEPYESFAGDGRPAEDGYAALDAMNWEPPSGPDGPYERDGREVPDAGSPPPDDAVYEPHPWSDAPPEYPATPPPPPPYSQQPPPGPYAPPIYGYDPPPSSPPPPLLPPSPPEAYPGPVQDQGAYYYQYYEPPGSGAADPPVSGPPPATPYELPPYQAAPYEAAPYEAAPPPYGTPPFEGPSYEQQQAYEYGAPQYGPPDYYGPADYYGSPQPPPQQDPRYEEPPLLPFEPAPDPPPGPPPGPPMGPPAGQQPPPAQPYYPPPMPYPQPDVAQPGSAPPWQQPPGPPGPPAPPPQTAESLSPETLLRGRKTAPSHGWRRAVYKASIGVVHLGESPAEMRRRQLVHWVRTPVAGGHHRVAVMSLKGGVGKTTTTVGLGSTLAWLRGDRVVAVDANPDRGTLSDKVRLETAATVRDLLGERAHIQRYADVRAFTSQSLSRLEVLASDRDPAASEAFSEDDYRAVATVLEHYYSICLTDCGTGLLHSAMSGVLGLANQIVLVSSPSVDGARSASATLDWLAAHEYGDLVRGAAVVLSTVRPKSKSTVDINRLEQHFASRCRAVVRVPYDPHLEEGAEVDLDRLRPETRDAYLTLAATVGAGFAMTP